MTRDTGGSDGDRRTEADQERAAEGDRQGQSRTDAVSDWFADAAIRAGLMVIGVVLLLFALGQAVGLPLLELASAALTSQTGQWLVVAFFAVLLIGAAQRGVPTG